MYKILLVDDEILVRDAIRENIDWGKLDCELIGDCENGKQAVEFVKTHEVDIVLTDILMPYMDGMELSHFLHDNYPDVLIVIFSGFGEFEYAKKAIQYNVSEYMLKPVTAMELTKVIENMKEKLDSRKKEQRKMESLTQVSQDYHKNANVIRSKALDCLVKCTREVQVSLDELERMGITFQAASYRVAVFDIDTYSEMYQMDMDKQQESALMAFVLFNVGDEIVVQEKAGVVYQEGNNRVCIIFAGNRTKEFSENIHRICHEIQKKVKEVIGLETSIGIGSWVRSPYELIYSYRLAAKAIDYRYLLGGNLLFDMEEKKTDNSIFLINDLETLTEAIKSGDRRLMEETLGQIETEIKSALVEKSYACIYLQQVIRAIGNTCQSLSEEPEKIIAQREALLKAVTEQRTFSQAAALVEKYAQEVFDELQELNSSSGQRQGMLAMDYIQKNYMDPCLSLNSICSYLNISTSYFSTIFKEMTGETFIEVLTRVRMEKAKELLENTTMKNYEIAEKVGFSDPHYFGISFKKITGKTPTEYAREKRR
ncbi:response regulator [Blautia wexlerae]|uniref:Stage 0 sporulation protein A homolog n=1 Tax=Blautia wexlerae TaxID=418240 RepID=A0ABX2GIX2_9FIRM|nr:response regulator [Blautia wexlerae]NSF72242.1 response regulator [Blautia wexlerae]